MSDQPEHPDVEPRHLAQFSVSPALLEQALHLPKGYHIIGAEWNFAERGLRVFLEGPDLPEVEAGQCIPVIRPVVSKTFDVETAKDLYAWHWSVSKKA